MKHECNELVECETSLLFMVIMNRDSYSQIGHNGKKELIFADRVSNNQYFKSTISNKI